MLSEPTATQIYSETPKVPLPLLTGGALESAYSELQGDTAIHSEADNIATYIIYTGFTYAEGVVTLASEECITKPVGHSVLVPLRVLNRLCSHRSMSLSDYASTFQRVHLQRLKAFIISCIDEQLPPRGMFIPNEQPPWEAMGDVCSRLIRLLLPMPDTKPKAPPLLHPMPKAEKKPPHLGKPKSMAPKPPHLGKPKSMAPKPPHLGKPKSMAPKPPPPPSSKARPSRPFPKSYDDNRESKIRYRRRGKLMCVYIQDGHVYMKCESLPKIAWNLLTEHEFKLGLLGEFGVVRAENENRGEGDSDNMLGLNELIDDVNHETLAPLPWLLSHVLNGRIYGSNEEGSTSSWFPQCSLAGQSAHKRLLLHRVTGILGPLLSDTEGRVVLPARGYEMIGVLKRPSEAGESSSIVRVEWRSAKGRERYAVEIDKAWKDEELVLC